MAAKQIRIELKDILQDGTSCVNPTITWEPLGDLVQNCELVGDAILVSSVDGTGCLNVTIDCEDCDVCPSQVFKVCLCNTSDDCEECHNCVNGICVNRCPDGTCVDDVCVKCTTDEDCTCNQICTPSGCQCEPGKILIDDCCYDCISDSDCDACEICQDGNCVPKCPGACEDGECKECVSSSDCIGRSDGRECCVNDECECCPDKYYDPVSGQCEPLPICLKDSECPPCQRCVSGNCVPVECPDGYVNIGLSDNCCVRECDCDNPSCPQDFACVPYDVDTCLCSECTGNCIDDADCGVGCYCENGKCVPNPCFGPCSTSLDCAFGCGCKDGECFPCDRLDCQTDECEQVDGCKCFGSNCIQDPCEAPCVNGTDCADGCGCKDGRCVSCDKLDCDECKDVLGCVCEDGTNCIPKLGCDNVPCVTTSDCPQDCTCYQGQCAPCEDFDCVDCPERDGCACVGDQCSPETPDDCTDIFTLAEDEVNCDLIATLSKEECCTCTDISVKVQPDLTDTTGTFQGFSVSGYDPQYDFEILKDGVLLSNTGVINEDKFSASFSVTSEIAYRIYETTNGVETLVTDSIATVTNSQAVVDQDQFSISTAFVPKTGQTVSGAQRLVVDSVTTTVRLTSTATFFNECVYNPSVITIYTTLSETLRVVNLSSDSCRLPIFTWLRGKGSPTVEFRKVYVPLTGVNYVDTIEDCEDGLWSGYDYKVLTDCGCDKDTDTLTALFCPNPFTFEFDPINCATEITVTNVFVPCDVNGDLSAQGCSSFPSDAQVEWILKLNNIEAGRFVLPTDQGSLLGNHSLPGSPTITSVKFEHSQDPSCAFTDNDVKAFDVSASIDCSNGGTITLSGDTPFNTVIKDSDGNTVASGTGTSFTGIGYGTFTVEVTKDGCTEIIMVTLNQSDCCIDRTLTTSYIPGSLTIGLNPLDASLGPFTYSIDGGTAVATAALPVVVTTTLTNGSHTIVVTDSTGCSYTGVVNVDNCDQTTLNATVTFNLAADTVTVTGITGGLGPYTIEFNGQTVTNATGATFSSSGLEGIYTVKITDANGCIETFEVSITRCPDFDANMSYDCSTTDVIITMNNGTAPYDYELRTGSGALVFSGTAATASETFMQSISNGSYTLTVTDAEGCVDVDSVTINCVCSDPILMDVTNPVCNGSSPELTVTNISGGSGTDRVIYAYDNATCTGTPIVTQNIGSASSATVPLGVESTDYSIEIIDGGGCTSSCVAVSGISCSCDGFYTLTFNGCACDGTGCSAGFVLTMTGDYSSCTPDSITGLTVTDDLLNPLTSSYDPASPFGPQIEVDISSPTISDPCPAGIIINGTIDLIGAGPCCDGTTVAITNWTYNAPSGWGCVSGTGTNCA